LHVLVALCWQGFRTVAGMVAVVTAVLAGSAVGLASTVQLPRKRSFVGGCALPTVNLHSGIAVSAA
jgi:hypothetical protein